MNRGSSILGWDGLGKAIHEFSVAKGVCPAVIDGSTNI